MKNAIRVACATVVCLAIASTARLVLAARANIQDRAGVRQALVKANEGAGPYDVLQLPTGQFVTPTAMKDSVQQFLNPGLPQYPDFVAGMAVRSQLSPDGTTLPILTAGQNSLY